MSGDANEPPSEYQLIGPAEDGSISDLLSRKTAKEGVPSINPIRRRNPGIQGTPAIGFAGRAEGRPGDDEAR